MYLPHVRRLQQRRLRNYPPLHRGSLGGSCSPAREERVRLGGHAIPQDSVRRRYHRGLELFLQTYRPLFDLWYHWKTDEEGLKLFASKAAGR